MFSQLSSFACQALSCQSSPEKKPEPVQPSRATEIFTPLTESLTFGSQTCLYLREDSALGHGRLSLSLGMAAFRKGLGCCFSNPQLLGGNALSVPTAFLHALARSNLLSSWLHLHRQNRLLCFYSELQCGSRKLTEH